MTLKMTFVPEYLERVAQYTKINNHNAARITITAILAECGVEDPELKEVRDDYAVVAMLQTMAGHMTPKILGIRNWADSRLKSLLRKRVTNHSEVWGIL